MVFFVSSHLRRPGSFVLLILVDHHCLNFIFIIDIWILELFRWCVIFDISATFVDWLIVV